jgi:peptidyl-prolyl cis-trans isomerase C
MTMLVHGGLRKCSLLPLIAAAAIAVLLSSCGRPPEGSSLGTEIRRGIDPVVAATVNGKPIYVDDVIVQAAYKGRLRPGERLEQSSDAFYQSLQELVEGRLLAMEAEARGLDKDPTIRHRLDSARVTVLYGAMAEHMRDTVVTDDNVNRLYRETVRALGRNTKVRASHILTETRDQAIAAKTRVDRGDPFAVVAREMSVDSQTRLEGGDLGLRVPESYPEALQEAVRATEIGEVVGPIQSSLGWHLIRVESREADKPPSIESVREIYEENVYQAEMAKLVDKLRRGARVELYLDEEGADAPSINGLAPRGGIEPPAAADPAPVQRAPAAPAPTARPAPEPAPQASPEPRPRPRPAERPPEAAAAAPPPIAAAPAMAAPPPEASPAPLPQPEPPVPGERET